MADRRYALIGHSHGAGGVSIALDDLTDVTAGGPSSQDVLAWSGSAWVARPLVEADISDLGSYLTSETNDLSASVTWADVPDANITQTSVTQHESALTITESQISDFGSYLSTPIDTLVAEGISLEDSSDDTEIVLTKRLVTDQTNIVLRNEASTVKWRIGAASNDNDDFYIANYNDSGVFQNTPVYINSVDGYTKVDAAFAAGGNGSDNFTFLTFNQGIIVADRTVNKDPLITFYDDTAYTSRQGFVQFADSGTFIRNEVHGTPFRLSSEDVGGAIVTFLTCDADNFTDLNGDTGIRFQIGGTTVAGYSGSFAYMALPLFIKEQAAAASDISTYGQLWVKNTTPCQLWFTDDAGTDTQIV